MTLLRHGQAEPADGFPEDFERTLTRRGASEAREIAARIARRSPIPELILVSPAMRTWATAAQVAVACELDSRQVRSARELYLAAPATLWRLVTSLNPGVGHVLVCGHNPALSQIASRLGPKPRSRELATAGVATAVWSATGWADLEPETAVSCTLDGPQDMADSDSQV